MSNEWEVVQEESSEVFQFENYGDVLVGTFRKIEHIEPEEGEPFDRIILDTDDGSVGVNPSYSLTRAFAKVNVGDLVRITYVQDIQTARGLNPMKDFRVEVKRASF